MPESFELANVLVALGGDIGNTVPKYAVTAAEIAVLQVIHGSDAVTDIKAAGRVERSNRTERGRLDGIYANAKDSNGNSLLEKLYPGAAARLFHDIDELELADSQFAVERVARVAGQKATADRQAYEAGMDLATQSDIRLPASADDEDAANGVNELPGDDQPFAPVAPEPQGDALA